MKIPNLGWLAAQKRVAEGLYGGQYGFPLNRATLKKLAGEHRSRRERSPYIEYYLVLVVTGKGALGETQTLRHQLPRCLNEPPLCQLVCAFHHPAKIQDGGPGAFYVELRKGSVHFNRHIFDVTEDTLHVIE